MACLNRKSYDTVSVFHRFATWTGVVWNCAAPTLMHFGTSVVSRSGYYWGYQVKALFLIFASSTSIAIYCLRFLVQALSRLYQVATAGTWLASFCREVWFSFETGKSQLFQSINKQITPTYRQVNFSVKLRITAQQLHPFRCVSRHFKIRSWHLSPNFTFRNYASCARSVFLFIYEYIALTVDTDYFPTQN
jgi:hypothetical protein